jgi:3-phosphoshikimate 1-carboxyvinyltransferase
LLATLNSNEVTTIIEPEMSRDHTELMMKYLGLKINSHLVNESGKMVNKITFQGGDQFSSKDFYIPGDISSAAFIMVAALIVPGSKVRINNVGINSLRDGIVISLQEMGADIRLENQRLVGGEKVADIIVKHSSLNGVLIPSSRTPKMIDEYPIMAIAAANAKGVTRMEGLEELKVKESNRLSAIYNGLKACGIKVEIGGDYLEIEGGVKQKNEISMVETHMDHRIAMSFLIMGLLMDKGVQIDDYTMIKTSFPSFMEIFSKLGVVINQ